MMINILMSIEFLDMNILKMFQKQTKYLYLVCQYKLIKNGNQSFPRI